MFLRPLAYRDGDARTRRPVRAATVAAPPGHGDQFAPWHDRDGPAGHLYHVAHGTNIIGGAPGRLTVAGRVTVRRLSCRTSRYTPEARF
ncbi:MAG: hypothetical protein N2378_10280 [Chloroflexaceae bacterium]|nr:hypothetical protein [Chloroflexaceae bacterium]